MFDPNRHVSCRGCGTIWHEKDLNTEALCPDCSGEPSPAAPEGGEEPS